MGYTAVNWVRARKLHEICCKIMESIMGLIILDYEKLGNYGEIKEISSDDRERLSKVNELLSSDWKLIAILPSSYIGTDMSTRGNFPVHGFRYILGKQRAE